MSHHKVNNAGAYVPLFFKMPICQSDATSIMGGWPGFVKYYHHHLTFQQRLYTIFIHFLALWALLRYWASMADAVAMLWLCWVYMWQLSRFYSFQKERGFSLPSPLPPPHIPGIERFGCDLSSLFIVRHLLHTWYWRARDRTTLPQSQMWSDVIRCVYVWVFVKCNDCFRYIAMWHLWFLSCHDISWILCELINTVCFTNRPVFFDQNRRRQASRHQSILGRKRILVGDSWLS